MAEGQSPRERRRAERPRRRTTIRARVCARDIRRDLARPRAPSNNSKWLSFQTVTNEHWHDGRVVLIGDAAHTAHWSIGSGTKLAMEDAIALAWSLEESGGDVSVALDAYELERKPVVTSTQRAAQASLEWFEHISRYVDQEPEQFAFNLLTRSRRITYNNLRLRDGAFVDRVDEVFAAGVPGADDAARGLPPRPPMFLPFRLRDLELPNRVVVSPMDMYVADDGAVGDFHLVHLGSRAIGGAGLVMTEMICTSPEGRITPGCGGLYREDHVDGWKSNRRFRSCRRRHEDRRANRTQWPQGCDEADVGRHGRATRRKRLAADRAIANSLFRAQPGAARDDAGGHGGCPRSIRGCRRSAPTEPGSTCWKSTWRTAICCLRSCRR